MVVPPHPPAAQTQRCFLAVQDDHCDCETLIPGCGFDPPLSPSENCLDLINARTEIQLRQHSNKLYCIL